MFYDKSVHIFKVLSIEKKSLRNSFLSFFFGGGGENSFPRKKKYFFRIFPSLTAPQPSLNWCSMIRKYIFSWYCQQWRSHSRINLFFGGEWTAVPTEEELFLLNISQPYSLANPHSTDVQWSERTYFHNMVNKEEVIPTFLSFFGGGDGAIVSHGGRTISFEYFPALQPREPSFNWCSMIRAYIFSQHGQ